MLSNALRHTQPGGTVSIAAQPHGDEITITVTDTGEGMTREQLPHIFERFYRGDTARDRDHSGTGIGLTISKAIIDAHGGTISATSPGPGRGSTFDVAIPRLVPSTAARSTPL
ncbi:MAG: ATP-binding protein [Dermatophilaceae bacterium]